MENIVLAIHILLALGLIGVVLMQRSEGGGLGMGGGGGGSGGGGMGGMMSSRGTANLLTRTTAILATAFIGTSLTLAIMAKSEGPRSILDSAPGQEQGAEPALPDALSVPEPPAAPAAPQPPMAQ